MISNRPVVNIVRRVLKLTSCTYIYALENNLTVCFDISRPLDLDARTFQFINAVLPLTRPCAFDARDNNDDVKSSAILTLWLCSKNLKAGAPYLLT